MNNQFTILAKKTLKHMQKMHGGVQAGGILLAGDPGLGKTTFVKTFCDMLGLESIVIEVPHVTEEHIINIPFLVYDPRTKKTTSGSEKVDTSEFRVKLADSHLFTAIKKTRKMNEDEYIRHITSAKASPAARKLFQALGGTKDNIPRDIVFAREHFNNVLFLDEYYRKTSVRIRNIMRGLLNGNLGIHKVPLTTYIIYASNMHDEGLDDIPSNNHSKVVKFKAPTKDEWFSWFITKYKNHPKIKLNLEVIEKFQQELEDEDISYDDFDTNVRTSPRRWEQLILHLNTSIPVKDEKEAASLLTFVKHQFIDHETETHSKLYKKVLAAVSAIIKKTSNIDINPTSGVKKHHEWKDVLEHYIEQVKRGGGLRKHVPVLSGPPGIGKTTLVRQIANRHDLVLIEIDCAELEADDVTGLPLQKNSGQDKIEVKFSEPKLFKRINKTIRDGMKIHKQVLGDKKYEKYKSGEWKYLIFFDEINRSDEKTFNALRRVLLERNFGPKGDGSGGTLDLPKGSIIVAAMNPEPDAGGTSQLTHHIRDVMDVIPAKASWNDTKKYMARLKMPGVTKEEAQSALHIIAEFVRKFQTKDSLEYHSAQQRPFHIDVGSHTMYVSPRQYVDIYSSLASAIEIIMDDIADQDIDLAKLKTRIVDDFTEAFVENTSLDFHRMGVDESEFEEMVHIWLSSLDDKEFGDLLVKKVKVNEDNFHQTLVDLLNGKKLTDISRNEFFVEGNDHLSDNEIQDEIKDVFSEQIDSLDRLYTLMQKTEGEVQLSKDGEDVEIGSKKTSKLINFGRVLIIGLHIHGYSYSRIEIMTNLKRHLHDAIEKVEPSDEEINANPKVEKQIDYIDDHEHETMMNWNSLLKEIKSMNNSK